MKNTVSTPPLCLKLNPARQAACLLIIGHTRRHNPDPICVCSHLFSQHDGASGCIAGCCDCLDPVLAEDQTRLSDQTDLFAEALINMFEALWIIKVEWPLTGPEILLLAGAALSEIKRHKS